MRWTEDWRTDGRTEVYQYRAAIRCNTLRAIKTILPRWLCGCSLGGASWVSVTSQFQVGLTPSNAVSCDSIVFDDEIFTDFATHAHTHTTTQHLTPAARTRHTWGRCTTADYQWQNIWKWNSMCENRTAEVLCADSMTAYLKLNHEELA